VLVIALIEIRAEDVAQVRKVLEPEEYVVAFYELMGRFNIGVIVEVKNQQALFEVVTKIRESPGVHETKSHVVHDGVVI